MEDNSVVLVNQMAVNPHIEKMNIYIAAKDFEKALICIDQAIEIEPSNQNHYYLKGI